MDCGDGLDICGLWGCGQWGICELWSCVGGGDMCNEHVGSGDYVGSRDMCAMGIWVVGIGDM